jgi:hypothetical protein
MSIKLVFKEEYLRGRKQRKTARTIVKTTDVVLETVEQIVPGKAGKSARLLRELLRIISGQ